MKLVEEYIIKLRREYTAGSLDKSEVDPDPLNQLSKWLEEAVRAEVKDPHAMVIATASPEGAPSARFVLLRGIGPEGLVFYTNYRSRKAAEIFSNPRAAAVLYWGELDRQVRVEGEVTRISEAESDNYFGSRPRDSQIAAWASNQSEILSSRNVLEESFTNYAAKFARKIVPRPPEWGGLIILPAAFEFWQGRPKRLHDRLLYSRSPDKSWKIERLAP